MTSTQKKLAKGFSEKKPPIPTSERNRTNFGVTRETHQYTRARLRAPCVYEFTIWSRSSRLACGEQCRAPSNQNKRSEKYETFEIKPTSAETKRERYRTTERFLYYARQTMYGIPTIVSGFNSISQNVFPRIAVYARPPTCIIILYISIIRFTKAIDANPYCNCVF